MFWQKSFVCSLVFVYGTIAFAQDSINTTSSTLKKSYPFVYQIIHKDTYGKHIIKYNPMATALFSDPRNVTFGYERTTLRNQSASINVGVFFIPKFISNDTFFDHLLYIPINFFTTFYVNTKSHLMAFSKESVNRSLWPSG